MIQASNNPFSCEPFIGTTISGVLDKLIFIGTITVTGNQITIPLNAQWIINNITYNTTTNTNINIPFSSAGFIRKDIIVANSLSQIVKISGTQSNGIAVAPPTPINTILITEIRVTQNSIDTPTPPIVGDVFRTKKEKGETVINDNASIDSVILQSNASYRFINSIATIKGINLNPTQNNAGLLYDGKEFTFSNQQATNITLLNNATVDLPFSFPNNANVVLLPGEVVKVKFSDYSGKLELISKNKVASSGTTFTKLKTFVKLEGFQTVTGTTAPTKQDIIIPANTFLPNCLCRISAISSRSGTTGGHALSTTFNSINLGVNILTNTVEPEDLYYTTQGIFKTFFIKNGFLRRDIESIVHATIKGGRPYEDLAFDVTVNNTLNIWIIPYNSTMVINIESLIIEIFEV